MVGPAFPEEGTAEWLSEKDRLAFLGSQSGARSADSSSTWQAVQGIAPLATAAGEKTLWGLEATSSNP